ncbi:MAG: ATP-dependent Clp protease ATP-binding subunit, partial [Actinomycetota bacterium]|nr:ATP-dependent Clp protease ATP-binding subunit [Actinomycetota bacterium]
MGVSKQAAQKRFRAKGHAEDLEPLDPGQGFARFTVETRNAILAAHDAARARGEATVTAARVALALADTPLLTGFGVGAERLGDALAPALPAPGDAPLEVVPYDESAREALKAAFGEAIRLGADMVEPRHVLLGLLQVDGLGDRLAQLGLTAERVQATRRRS